MDPNHTVVEVADYAYATSQLAQTTLRSVCGQAELDELLSAREKISLRLQEILDKETDPWGIKVSKVELKHINLPTEMQRAMAKQAEAERERRTVVLDMPPLLASDDVLAFSPHMDGVLLVVAEGTTSRSQLQRTREVLTEMNLLGVVLNRSAERNDQAYYSYRKQ